MLQDIKTSSSQGFFSFLYLPNKQEGLQRFQFMRKFLLINISPKERNKAKDAPV